MTNRAGIETRDRILIATRGLLAEGGLEATTVSAICREAGIRPGSFYNLFSSKEQAILSVVREAIRAVDPDPFSSGTDTLAELAEAYVRFFTEQETLARVYLLVALGGGVTDAAIRGRVLRHHQRRLERFVEALGRERPDLAAGDVEQWIEALLAALNGYALHRLLDDKFDLAGHARRLLDTVPV